MNENNKNKKSDKKSGKSVWIWITAAIIFFADILGEALPTVLGFLLIFAVPIGIIVVVIYAEKKKKGKAGAERAYSPEPKKYTAPDREYYDSDCMEADTGHDHDRRAEQLEAFLKNGLIDKEEYEMMKSRYERMGYGR